MKSFKSLLADEVNDSILDHDSMLQILSLVTPREYAWLKNDYSSRFEPWECSFGQYLLEVVVREHAREASYLRELGGVKFHSQTLLLRSSEAPNFS